MENGFHGIITGKLFNAKDVALSLFVIFIQTQKIIFK